MKKNMISLNEEQRQLVESCLSGERMALVHRAIREHIVVNETIFGCAKRPPLFRRKKV